MDREITITVTDDEARRIDERVASGEFDSVADVVRAALASFDAVVRPLSDAVVLQLLEEEQAIGGAEFDIPEDVLQALLDEDDADADRGVSADIAFAQVKANLEAKYGKG